MKRFWLVSTLIIVVLLIVFCSSIFYSRFYQKKCSTNGNSTSPTQPTYTYESSKMGFSLVLPSEYMITESYNYEGGLTASLSINKRTVDSSVLEGTNFSIIIYQDNSSLDALKKAIFARGSIIDNEKKIKIDGQDALEFDLGGMTSGQKIIASNGKYSIDAEVYPAVTNIDFNKIVSSFKFPK